MVVMMTLFLSATQYPLWRYKLLIIYVFHGLMGQNKKLGKKKRFLHFFLCRYYYCEMIKMYY